jgi:arylsulfatase
VHEGGIATPLIVHWPGVVQSNSCTDQVGHIIDLLPTCLEIAGRDDPKTRGGQTLLPVEGSSLVPILRGQTRPEPETLCWEWSGNRAIRQGPWKLVRDNTVGSWELYHMRRDRTEMHDLAARHPDRVAEMSQAWRSWTLETGVDPDRSVPIRLKPR